MEAIETEVQNSSNMASFERNNTLTGLLKLYPSLKRTERSRSVLTYVLSIAYPKDEFLLPITDVMIDNMCGFERMSFMNGFLGYNQIKMYPNDHFEHHWACFAIRLCHLA